MLLTADSTDPPQSANCRISLLSGTCGRVLQSVDAKARLRLSDTRTPPWRLLLRAGAGYY